MRNLNSSLNWSKWLTSKWVQRFLYSCLSATFLVTLAPASRAASGASQSGVSTATVLSVIVGLIITAFYLRGMYLVLHYASETYDVDFDFVADADSNSKARNILILGSFLLVVISALIISSYGWASLLLYIGPILCLLGPIVVIVSMEIDLKKYKQALRHKQLNQSASQLAIDSAYEADRDFDPQTRR